MRSLYTALLFGAGFEAGRVSSGIRILVAESSSSICEMAQMSLLHFLCEGKMGPQSPSAIAAKPDY